MNMSMSSTKNMMRRRHGGILRGLRRRSVRVRHPHARTVAPRPIPVPVPRPRPIPLPRPSPVPLPRPNRAHRARSERGRSAALPVVAAAVVTWLPPVGAARCRARGAALAPVAVDVERLPALRGRGRGRGGEPGRVEAIRAPIDARCAPGAVRTRPWRRSAGRGCCRWYLATSCGRSAEAPT